MEEEVASEAVECVVRASEEVVVVVVEAVVKSEEDVVFRVDVDVLSTAGEDIAGE